MTPKAIRRRLIVKAVEIVLAFAVLLGITFLCACLVGGALTRLGVG